MIEKPVFLWDFGNVLVEWNVLPLLDEIVPPTVNRAEFDRLFFPLNAEADRTTWADIIATIENGGVPLRTTPNQVIDKNLIPFFRAVKERHPETITKMEPSIELLKFLHDSGYRNLGASNWAADTFDADRPFLNEWFLPYLDGMQISGYVGLIKPEPEFYKKLLADFNVAAENAIFMDDRKENIEAAEKIGIKGILFSSAEQLHHDLSAFVPALSSFPHKNTP